MEILISTNMYQACDFAKVLELTDAFSQERVGVEVFSMFHHNSHFPCLMQLCSYHDSIQLSSYAFILT